MQVMKWRSFAARINFNVIKKEIGAAAGILRGTKANKTSVRSNHDEQL